MGHLKCKSCLPEATSDSNKQIWRIEPVRVKQNPNGGRILSWKSATAIRILFMCIFDVGYVMSSEVIYIAFI